MTYKQLLNKYNEMFPDSPPKKYRKKGPNTIQLIFGEPFIDVVFTYFSPVLWRLETVDYKD